jgi:hypothetical protein
MEFIEDSAGKLVKFPPLVLRKSGINHERFFSLSLKKWLITAKEQVLRDGKTQTHCNR